MGGKVLHTFSSDRARFSDVWKFIGCCSKIYWTSVIIIFLTKPIVIEWGHPPWTFTVPLAEPFQRLLLDKGRLYTKIERWRPSAWQKLVEGICYWRQDNIVEDPSCHNTEKLLTGSYLINKFIFCTEHLQWMFHIEPIECITATCVTYREYPKNNNYYTLRKIFS